MAHLCGCRAIASTEADERRKEQERQRADRHRQEGEARTCAEIPGRSAEHRYEERLAIADGEHRRRDPRHVRGCAQQRRQRQSKREDRGANKAQHAGAGDGP